MTENERLVLVIVLAFAGLQFLGLRYWIRYRGWDGIASESKMRRVTDRDGGAWGGGGNVLLLGGLSVIASVALLLLPPDRSHWLVLGPLLVGTAVVVGCLVIGNRRYMQ